MIDFHSAGARRCSLHTAAMVGPHLRDGDVVLDIGCGAAYVTTLLAARHAVTMLAVDIVDCRRVPTPHFALYDGITLPLADASCDVVIVGFTLHHIPNDTKPAVIADIRRVARRTVIVFEDTPRNFIDRYYNRKHGEEFRRRIDSTAPYGFYSQREWEAWFPQHGLRVVESIKIGRFARDRGQPFARSCFVLEPA